MIHDRKKILTVTFNPAIDLACSVPGLALGQVNRVTDFRSDAGGKGVNIARLLRLFGLPVSATGFLGSENTDIFEKLFRGSGIEDLFVRVPGVTRTGIKLLDPEMQTTTDLNFPGLSPQPHHLGELFKVIECQLTNVAAVIIAGSLPPGVAPDVMDDLVGLIKGRGVKTFVDSSGAALARAIDAKPSFIKPNQDELAEYLGKPLAGETEIIAEVEKLLDSGIETVVVSLGERGAIFAEQGNVLIAIPPQVTAVSTVGAGDAVVGTMAVGMVMGLSLAERARLATAVSAAVVTQAGPGLSSLAEARELENQVVIKVYNTSGGANE